MKQPRTTTYSIADFIEWQASRQLVIAPKFQRRNFWIPKAKSYLIDTILRGMPIPPLFIRSTIDPKVRKSVRDVVDGQQRLHSVFEYIEGKFPILKAHNKEFGGMFYRDLPEAVQQSFLNYHFSVSLLADVSDSEVLNIFARLNTYTEPLNAQELRNSKYFGAFKQCVYKLAHEYYTFWRNNNILTEHQVARMKDAELVSVLAVTMLDGIRQTKETDLRTFYEMYDDDFSKSDRIAEQFGAIIDLIGDVYGQYLSSTPFKRLPLFYSLFIVFFDAVYILPKSGNADRIKFSSKRRRGGAEKLTWLSGVISDRNPPERYLPFVQATRLSTADVDKRRLRHQVIWNEVILGSS